MKEQLCLCDGHGRMLPGTIARDALDARPEGAFGRVCDVWFADRQGRLLLQKRAMDKAVNPGRWSCTGGCIRAGESPEEGCIRECREELGLTPDMNCGGLIMGYCGRRVYHDVWLFRQDVPREAMVLQPGEVDDAGWFAPEEIRAMLRRGEAAPPGYMEQLLAMLPVLCAFGKEGSIC